MIFRTVLAMNLLSLVQTLLEKCRAKRWITAIFRESIQLRQSACTWIHLFSKIDWTSSVEGFNGATRGFRMLEAHPALWLYALREITEWVYQRGRPEGPVLSLELMTFLRRPKWVCLSDVGSYAWLLIGFMPCQAHAKLWKWPMREQLWGWLAWKEWRVASSRLASR